MFDVLAPDMRNFPVQARPNGGNRERERERRQCCTHTLDSGCWLSESGSQWLEAEMNPASSVAVTQGKSTLKGDAGGVDGYDTPGLDKNKKDQDEWTNEAKNSIARYRGIAWTAGKNTATRYSDPAMTVKIARRIPRGTTAVDTSRAVEGVK